MILLLATSLIVTLCKSLQDVTKYTKQLTYTILGFCGIFLGIVIKVRNKSCLSDQDLIQNALGY